MRKDSQFWDERVRLRNSVLGLLSTHPISLAHPISMTHPNAYDSHRTAVGQAIVFCGLSLPPFNILPSPHTALTA
ncbi:MAG: hypothetical protein JWQ49_3186, partial [Edaphobacter sp.]|nr:hypothetical protein [Edaphobacter sp.]